MEPLRPLAFVVTGLILFSACSSDSTRREPFDSSAQAMNTPTHTNASILAFNDARAAQPKLAWLMDARDAAYWGNDPDCARNDCGPAKTSDPPTSILNGDNACWAFRNPDHFGNNAPSVTSAGAPAYSWSGFSNPGAPAAVPREELVAGGRVGLAFGGQRPLVSAWIPADSGAAVQWLRAAALELVSHATDGNPEQVSAALRYAFDACHYLEDQQACGHPDGNHWCRPIPNGETTPSNDCKQFVRQNAGAVGSVNGVALDTFVNGYDFLSCDTHPAVSDTLALRYAAAERYIRHRSHGNTLVEGGTWSLSDPLPADSPVVPPDWDPGGPIPWGTGNAADVSHDTCADGCTSGECLPGAWGEASGSEPVLRTACTNLINTVMTAAEQNSKLVTSASFKLGNDGIGLCRDYPNQRTCVDLGGDPTGSQCWKKYHDGTVANIGNLTSGASFGGGLPRECARPSSDPSHIACVTRCADLGGYVGADGLCWAPRGLSDSSGQSTSFEINITNLACVDYTLPNGAQCTPWTNPEICTKLGGYCDSSTNECKLIEGVGQQPWLTIGTCSPSGPFRPGMKPPCDGSIPVVTSTIEFCNGDGAPCDPATGCCPGMNCGNPLHDTGFYSSSDTPVCYWPDAASRFQEIGLSLTGGSGSVFQPNTGLLYSGLSLIQAVPGVPLTLVAKPLNGLASVWQGCDVVSADGLTCTVNDTSFPRSLSVDFAASTGCAGFPDVPANHVFCTYITKAKQKGLLPAPTLSPSCPFGSPAGGLCPDSATSRLQAAAYIVRGLLGESFSYSTTPYFDDVKATNPYFKYVQKLKDLGITSGCSPSDYSSSCSYTVTRGQLATFLMRAKYGETANGPAKFVPPSTPYFFDVSAVHPFYRYVQQMARLGITSGCGGNYFCPDKPVTEGEAATFLTRVFFSGEVPAGQPPAPLPPNVISVVSATYGQNVGTPFGNATQKLADACNGSMSCNYFVSVLSLGDPAPGQTKNFVAQWTCSSSTMLKSLTVPAEANGRLAQLSCP